MLEVAEASGRILAKIGPLETEQVPLLESLGRVLARPAIATITMPPWTNSGMDGYAVRAEDVLGASGTTPVRLPVQESVAAGEFPTGPLEPGVAVRIMTGAPLPQGADTVVRVEDTDGGTSVVEIRNSRDALHNVRRAGEDFSAGDELLAAGTAIGPAQIGVLASIGAATVEVHRRPRVALLGSGDELVELDGFSEVLAGRKIVSSNSYSLNALVRDSGGEPVDLGISPDDPTVLAERLSASAGCDLLVTSAGVSVGEFDFTRDVLASLGARMDFWRVRMRPGAPIGFGFLGAMPWIGLPGNPVSSMVTFELFVRPVVRRMLGHSMIFPRPVPVIVDEPIEIGASLTHFLRAVITYDDNGERHARLTGPQGSGILTSMTRANALLIVPHEHPRWRAGDRMSAIPLGSSTSLSESFPV